MGCRNTGELYFSSLWLSTFSNFSKMTITSCMIKNNNNKVPLQKKEGQGWYRKQSAVDLGYTEKLT